MTEALTTQSLFSEITDIVERHHNTYLPPDERVRFGIIDYTVHNGILRPENTSGIEISVRFAIKSMVEDE